MLFFEVAQPHHLLILFCLALIDISQGMLEGASGSERLAILRFFLLRWLLAVGGRGSNSELGRKGIFGRRVHGAKVAFIHVIITNLLELVLLLDHFGEKGSSGVDVLGPGIKGAPVVKRIDIFDPRCYLHGDRSTSCFKATSF